MTRRLNGRMRPDVDFVAEQADRMTELLRQRAALPRDDLEYVVQAISRLKDERLRTCVAELIGWGDDERAELETFIAVAIEVMKKTSVSRLREAALVVELRHYTQGMQ
jgi:hypothetical protein